MKLFSLILLMFSVISAKLIEPWNKCTSKDDQCIEIDQKCCRYARHQFLPSTNTYACGDYDDSDRNTNTEATKYYKRKIPKVYIRNGIMLATHHEMAGAYWYCGDIKHKVTKTSSTFINLSYILGYLTLAISFII